MQKLTKPLSILLSIVMIVSLFTIIPTNASVIDEKAQIIAQVADAELADEAEGPGSDIFGSSDKSLSSRSKDLAGTGANVELSETGHYNIAVGNITVKDDNYWDIFGDGRASYDPATKILTLRDPRINSVKGDTYGAIQIQTDGVTIKGSYHMNSVLSQYGLYVSEGNSVILEGDFTFRGKRCGVIGNDLTVNVGSLRAYSTNSYEDSCAIYSENFTVNNGINYVEMQCTKAAFVGDALNLNGTRIVSDDSFFMPSIRGIINPDVSDFTSRVVIRPYAATYYDLWLGTRHVDSNNYTDIYGDGTASYDPATKTLTLNDPDIRGAYVAGDELDDNYRIYSGYDLTVKGSYKMSSDQIVLSPDITPDDGDDGALYLRYGIYSTGDLTLDGDFAFAARMWPVSAENDIVIKSGTVKASDSLKTGIQAISGSLTVKGEVTKIDARSEIYPLCGKTGLTIEDGVHISTPRNGNVAVTAGNSYYIIYDPSTQSAAEHVVIESGTVERYNLFLAQTEVTSENCDDILGDGKASYSPSTKTLILRDPVINGTVQNGDNTFKILTSIALTLKGSYHMTDADADIAISSVDKLTFDGDFTFKGSNYAVYAKNGVTVKSGSLTAVGGGYAAVGAIDGELDFGSGITKVDMQGGTVPAIAKNINLNGVKVTSPSPYALLYIEKSNVYTIGNPGGTPNPRAVIEPDSEAYYNVWLGSTQVNSDNKDDILKDGGSAKYDPDTKTLTLSDPVITGYHKNNNYYFRIFSIDSLTLEGSYAMTNSDDITIALYSNDSLTLNGDFTFMGSNYGVYAQNDLTLSGGALKAVGGTVGLISNGAATIGENVIKLDAQGSSYALLCGSVTLADDLIFTDPVGGSIQILTADYSSAYNSSGNTVTRAVIERKPEPTEPPTTAPSQAPSTAPSQAPSVAPSQAPSVVPSQAPSEPPVGYYIVGSFTDWKVDEAYKMTRNTGAVGEEYFFNDLTLFAGSSFKVVTIDNDNYVWYPGGTGNDYEITASGRFDIYFRPNLDGGDDWYCNVIYVNAREYYPELEGEGTKEAPFLIKTSGDWDIFAAHIAAGNVTSGKYFKLADDITITSAVHNNPFAGVFDGDEHTITLNNLSGAPFGSISGATIKNLKIDGSVSGGRHISALVSGCEGVYENLIENVVVAADIATNDTYCGGFVGHGGSTAKTTLRNCVFSGTFSQGSTIGTFWGWSDKGSTPVLERCFDISQTDHPIGRGEPSGSITGCYYTNESKQTGGGRAWSNGGKRAYKIIGDEITLTLNGDPGLVYDGVIYAGEGDVVNLTVPSADEQYAVSAGAYSQNGSTLSISMPACEVTVSLTDNIYYSTYSSSSANAGYNNEGSDKLFDADTGTKWCGTTNNGTPVVYFITGTKVVPGGYRIATANDTANNSGRNPISWKLEASADGSSWVTLTDVSDFRALEAVNEKYYNFPLTNPTDEAYMFYRFTIKAIAGGSTFQLGELQLIGKDTGEEGENIEYDVWLGSTQVTFANRNDILGDGGKAKYDPLSNTLTLNDPTIEGEYVFGDDQVSCKIYCGIENMVIKGSYHMTEADTDRGIELHGAPVLDGNFTFMGKLRAILTNSDLTFRSGYVKAICPKTDAYAYPVYVNGVINFQDGFGALIAEGGISPILIQLSSEVYNVSDKFLISAPEGGYFDHKPNSSSVQYVFNADGTVADSVMIERNRDYDLWLGATRVTATNRKDILGDGKAQFDPFTNTLTLDNPKIEGYQSNGISSIKILAYMDLRISGSYLMEEADANINLEVSGNLTLNGEFMLRSWGYCIYCNSITIEAGSLIAAANWDYGIGSKSNIRIKEDVTRVEVYCGKYEALWYSSLTLDGKIGVSSPEDADVRSYSIYGSDGDRAHHVVFEPLSAIAFDVKGHGAAPDTQKLPIGQKVTQPDDLTDEAYDFGGWFTDAECTAPYDFDALVTDDITLYAKWTIKKYTVAFDTNGHGEAAPESQIVEYGSAAAEPVEPTDEVYDFTGWFTDKDCTAPYDISSAVKSDTTVYAGWTIKKYTVAFDSNGRGTAPGAQIIDHGSAVTKPGDLSDIAYNFEGWFTDKACTKAYDFSAGVTGDITLYAKWTIKKYTVTFDTNGHGAAPEARILDHGSVAELPNDLTEVGYAFMGWYTDRECKYLYNTSSEVTSDLTLYAKWELSGFTVTVVSANGSGAQYDESKLYNYGDEYTLPQCIFASPESMTFKAWDKGNVGDKITITENTVITAQWRKIYKLGDVDSDGDVTILDATFIQRRLAGLPIDVDFNEVTADADSDGEITILDATAIQRWLAGLPSNDRIGKTF